MKHRVPASLVEHVFAGWQSNPSPPPYHSQKKVHFEDPFVRPVEQYPSRFEFAKSRRERRPQSPPPQEQDNEEEILIDDSSDVEEIPENIAALKDALQNPRGYLSEKDWTEYYLTCPFWVDGWLLAHGDTVEEWPSSIEICDGRMFLKADCVFPLRSPPRWCDSITLPVAIQAQTDCGEISSGAMLGAIEIHPNVFLLPFRSFVKCARHVNHPTFKFRQCKSPPQFQSTFLIRFHWIYLKCRSQSTKGRSTIALYYA